MKLATLPGRNAFVSVSASKGFAHHKQVQIFFFFFLLTRIILNFIKYNVTKYNVVNYIAITIVGY